MKEVNPTIVLIPVSGTYVMTAEEASKAINELIKPKIVIPMHYGTIVGNKEDAIRFSQLVTVCKTKIFRVRITKIIFQKLKLIYDLFFYYH